MAARSNIVFTMLGYPTDVRAVLSGPEGILCSATPGTVVVDMTTSDPSLAVQIATEAAARRIHVLDAPVSGGDIGATNGTFSIMVGGPKDVFEAVRPRLEAMGSTIVRQGDHGTGQQAKLVNQTLVAASIAAVCEALVYVRSAGLDLARVLDSVSPGAAASWSLANLAPKILRDDFSPGFYVDHLVKYLSLVLSEARQRQVPMPVLAVVHQLFVSLQAQGQGRNGTQALIHAIAALAGRTWPAPSGR